MKEIMNKPTLKSLSFGTGGMRGIMGEGLSCMNENTVELATQGLANVILRENGQEKGVAIAYDSRNHSKEFCDCAARCLNGNGIRTYCFESICPTPLLSFAVRHLGCIAGIVITASHNPPQYNGYKVYWSDGGQVTAPKDEEIMGEVNQTNAEDVKRITKPEALIKGLYHMIGQEVTDSYIAILKKLVINPQAVSKMADQICIVYTPLHGSGNIPVRRILAELGFKNLHVVKEQELPDGDFPTVAYPNPESKEAFTLALQLAQKVDADLILATDPDADRLGVYSKDKKTGAYIAFTGNMSGLLLAEYLLSQKKLKKQLSPNMVLINTIVSSKMAKAMAKEYNIKQAEVLTGFKYIGEQIKKFETEKDRDDKFLFGYEESYGCLIGTYTRDKDAVSAAMLICEAAAYYKQCGLTLWDQMNRIYEKYGYYKEDMISLTLPQRDGVDFAAALMERLRKHPPSEIGGQQVIAVQDYSVHKKTNLRTYEESEIPLPHSDVLYYEMENDSWCCIRPSGTEPKIKFYIGTKSNSSEKAAQIVETIKKDLIQYTS